MLSSPIAVVRTSPPTMARARDPSTSAVSSPPSLSSLAFHCHSFSPIRKSSNLALVSCLSLVAGTSAVIRLLPGILLAMGTYSTPRAVSYMGLFWRMLQLLGKRILNSSDAYSVVSGPGCIISYVIKHNSQTSIIACKTQTSIITCKTPSAFRFTSIRVVSAVLPSIRSNERNNYRGLSSPTVAFSVADPTFTTRAAALIARASTWTQNRPQATKHNGLSSSRSAPGSRHPIGMPDVAPSCIA
jgi:hypothetical protein